MKFLLIVLTVHFIGEVISYKRKDGSNNKGDERNEKILHPAEFTVR